MSESAADLVARFGQACMTVQPVAPYTGADIARMLNDGSVIQQGDIIVGYKDAPEEGGTVVAHILNHGCQQGDTVWEVVPRVACEPCRTSPQARDADHIGQLNGWVWDLLEQTRLPEADRCIDFMRALIAARGNQPLEKMLADSAEARLEFLRGDVDRSARLSEEALDCARQQFGDDHTATAICKCNLAEAYVNCGRYAAAKPLMNAGLTWLRNPANADEQYSIALLAKKAACFVESEGLIAAHTGTAC